MTYKNPALFAARTGRPARRVIQLTVTLSALAMSLELASPVSAAPRTARHNSLPSATALVAEMKAALGKMSSVHLKIVATQSSPSVKETITQDSGKTSGAQYAVTGKEHASVLLTKSNAYISGNSSGLTAFFALPKDDLALVGSKWIVIKSGASQYKTFVSTITMKSLVSHLLPTSKPNGVNAVTYDSKPAYSIIWKVKSGTATTNLKLYIPRSGTKLPIAESAVSGTTTEQSTLSKWNEHIAIHIPTKTIAITKLHTT